MRVLLSGFEPFGDRPTNQSWAVAEKFAGEKDIDIVRLPVSYSDAHRILINKLESSDYDLVLMMGETSSTTDSIRLERVALNFKDAAMPDNDGLTAYDEAIVAGAPAAYFTAFPLKKIAGALNDNGHRVKITNSAGTFVCNHVYFNILHYLSENNQSLIALFVHLPASTESLSEDEMRNTIKALLTEYNQR